MIVDEILPQLPDFLVNRDPDSHKGHYGHALLVAGSFGKMGAAVLAAKACLRSGVGLLTVHVPRCGVEIMQTAVPEAMLSVDVNGDCFSQCPPDMDRYDAVAVGPGLGTYAMSFSAFHLLLKQMKRQPLPMVVDADGLNLLSMHKGVLMDCLPPMSILTPHAREFERLYCRQMEPSQAADGKRAKHCVDTQRPPLPDCFARRPLFLQHYGQCRYGDSGFGRCADGHIARSFGPM